MLYNWHRDYNPALGRYDQFDPSGLNGGINGYAYANGSPTSLVDPSGLLANVPMGSPVGAPTAPTPTQIPAPPGGAAPPSSIWPVILQRGGVGLALLLTPANAGQGPGCDNDPEGYDNPSCNPEAVSRRAQKARDKRASQQSASYIASIQEKSKNCPPDNGDKCSRQYAKDIDNCRNLPWQNGAQRRCISSANERRFQCESGKVVDDLVTR